MMASLNPPKQHHHREQRVHHTDALVVDGRDPLGPQPCPFALIGDQSKDRQDADDEHETRTHNDGLIKGDRA